MLVELIGVCAAVAAVLLAWFALEGSDRILSIFLIAMVTTILLAVIHPPFKLGMVDLLSPYLKNSSPDDFRAEKNTAPLIVAEPIPAAPEATVVPTLGDPSSDACSPPNINKSKCRKIHTLGKSGEGGIYKYPGDYATAIDLTTDRVSDPETNKPKFMEHGDIVFILSESTPPFTQHQTDWDKDGKIDDNGRFYYVRFMNGRNINTEGWIRALYIEAPESEFQ